MLLNFPLRTLLTGFLFLFAHSETALAQEQAETKRDEKGERLRPITVEMADDGRQFQFLGFSPDSRTLVYSLTDFKGKDQSTLVFYDVKEKKKIKTLKGPDPLKFAHAVMFLPDGKRLIVGYYGDKQPYLLDWHAEKFTRFEYEPGESSSLYRRALTAKGDYLISIGCRSLKPWAPVECHVWEVLSAKKVLRFAEQVANFCLSEDGQFLVALHAEAVQRTLLDPTHVDRVWFRVWDLARGKEIGLITKPLEIVYSPDRDPDNPAVRIFRDLVGEAPYCRVRISPAGKIMVVPVWPSETVLETAGIRGYLTLREMATGNELARFDAFSKGRWDVFGFSPDQTTLAASGGLMVATSKTALLVWDISPHRDQALQPKPRLSGDQVSELWAKFAQRDGARAFRAMRLLAARPQDSLLFLKQKVKPAPDRDEEIARLVVQLDHADVKLQTKAKQTLIELGDEAIVPLNKALETPLFQNRKKILGEILTAIKADNDPSTDTRQALWTIELLEFLASPEALKFLDELANGVSTSWVTQEARASISRIRNRK